jgi:hypothetical protein
MRRILALVALSVAVSLTLTACAFLFTRSEWFQARRAEAEPDPPKGATE